MLRLRTCVLSMDNLFVVEVAKSINELVDEILCFRDGQSFPLLDEVEHILVLRLKITPLVHNYSSIYTFSSS